MTAASRYWHTLRYLRPVQVWGRLWFRLYRPRPRLDPAPPFRPAARHWLPCAREQSFFPPNRFRFLNREADLPRRCDWRRRDVPLLWLYNLHYFDDLNAQGAQSRTDSHRRLIAEWIDANPPGYEVGWDPYPTSLRIVNWIKWHLAGNTLDSMAQHSLAVQAHWLRQRLEFHLQGNHLWANAKALVFAGALFSGPEAEKWLALGLELLRRELDEQILPDGGHFERSPMYHAIVLEDLLDMIQLSQCYPDLLADSLAQACQQKLAPVMRWLDLMSHPDGGLSFFNDAALGIAPSFSVLDDYSKRLGLRSRRDNAAGLQILNKTGYVRCDETDASLIADVGEIGPDYLPGHAHADTLSFELSLFGKRVIVNSGIDRYGSDDERLRQRGTAAHSTVEVDGQDSSEVWGGFRVARRARIVNISTASHEGVHTIRGVHDGYRRLAGKVLHTREWRLVAGKLRVLDTLSGTFGKALARFYLHSEVKAAAVSPNGCTLMLGQREIRFTVSGGVLSVVPSTYHPRFGVSEANICLVVEFDGPQVVSEFLWS